MSSILFARVVPAPEGYPRSSHGRNALGNADPVIKPHPLYLALGEGDETRRARQRSLFAGEVPEAELAALQGATNGGSALGSDRFQRQIAAMVGRRTWPGKSRRPKKEARDDKPLGLPV